MKPIHVETVKRYPKVGYRPSIGFIAFFIIFFGLIGVVMFPPEIKPRQQLGTLCLSYLKQVTMGTLIYASDNDDNLPSHFTFDGSGETRAFVAATTPYIAHDEMFLCPEFKYHDLGVKPLEGLPKVMDYVHSSMLKTIIPDYAEGHRTLNISSATLDSRSIPFLRDPLATKSPDDRNLSTTNSPHGTAFNFTFIDGHARKLKSPDAQRNL